MRQTGMTARNAMARKQNERRHETLQTLLQIARIVHDHRFPITIADVHREYTTTINKRCKRSIYRDIEVLIDCGVILKSEPEHGAMTVRFNSIFGNNQPKEPPPAMSWYKKS